ncbi:MAG: CDP-glucose 4,6-dehydratase [Chitinophagaceae bacterium]
METVVNLRQLQTHYKGKRVFITGHTGFKGAWLMALLHTLGASVKGYALAPEYEQGLYTLLEPLQIGESVIADIREKEKLAKEIEKFNPHFIFHLAAQPLVRRSYKIPSETFEVNAIGTANLLESLIDRKEKCTVVVITTDKVYENKELNVLYKETDRLGGYDPYSASKACTELVISSFRNSFFNPADFSNHQKNIVSARAGNVIGGGDWSDDRIVPDIVRYLQQQKEIAVRNPNAIRPWQHVLEPLTGYLLLGALLSESATQYSPAYNFGPLPADHLTVKELVETAIECWGTGTWKDTSDKNQVHEATLLQLDISLALKELLWQPKLTASQAIAWTIDWYKQPKQNQADFTFQQIKNYLSL